MTDRTTSLDLFLRRHGLSFDTAPTLEKWQGILRILSSQLSESGPSWQRAVLEMQWPMFITDASGVIKTWNTGCEKLFGYGPEMLGRSVKTLLPSSLEGLRLQGLLRQAAQGERLESVELRYVQADGTFNVMLCHIAPLPDVTGGSVDLVFTSTPLAGEPGTGIRSRHDFYESLLNALPAPVAIFDADHRYIFCNPAAIQSPEIREWILGKNDAEYGAYRHFDPHIAENRRKNYEQAVTERRTVAFEEEMTSPSGETVFQLRTYTPLFASDGSLMMNIGHGIEITRQKRTEQALTALNNELEERVQARTAQLERLNQQLQHDAFHDTLTGLPNRALFSDRLEQAIARAGQPKEAQYAVLFLDTDRFKGINDTLGHPAGDALLRELAARLRQVLRASDTVARQGGDEFTVLLEPVTHPEQIAQVAQRIQQELRHPVHLHGHDVSVSVSVGVVVGNTDYASAVDVLQDAEIAMYRAKASGRGGYQVFTPEMREQTVHRNLLENELRQGIGRDELRVFYQPIVKLDTGQVAGFEALVRWQHPERGLLGPGEFIHVAEEVGLTLEIDRWIMQRACNDMREWQAAHPDEPPLTLSVNFSADHFAAPDMLEHVQSTLAQTGFAPELLHLEITEGALLGQPQAIGETLVKLRGLGVQLHLDDFGTGYSSLSYLHSYPLDTLKIDRSFVLGMLEKQSSGELVRTIVAMAQNMQMSVIAEGIESAEQLAVLQELGCNYGQGYFFAKPLPLDEARQVVAQLAGAISPA